MNALGLLYVRVSSEDQRRGVSLDDQTNAGKGWFASQLPELEVVVFREEGESARTMKRTQLEAALRYIAKHPGRVRVFAVYDLSRFARNLFDQLSTERFLAESGVRLVSISQPLPAGPEGEFFSGQIGLMNQYLNQKQGEKISRCMVEANRQGRCTNKAPIGYQNATDDEGRRVVVLDPETSDSVREAFRKVAAGDGLRGVLAWLTERGVRGAWGGKIQPQRFRYLLANPFYVGRIRSIKHGFEAKGRHPALVDDETWNRVQRRMSRRSEVDSAQVIRRPMFPLRGFVLCERCGRPLTASMSMGKQGKRYGYYSCWAPDCGAVRGRRELLEGQLLDLLADVSVCRDHLRALAGALERRWREQAAEVERSTAAARRRVESLERKKKNLAESYALERAIDLATYDRLRRQLEGDLAAANLELGVTPRGGGTLADLLAFAEPYLTGLSNAWIAADLSGRHRLQRLIWPRGATFDGEQLRTPETASIFRVLGGSVEMKTKLVEQIGDSWNSIAEWIEAFCEAVAA